MPNVLWLLYASLAAALALGCLRAIGFEYSRAVRWHNLRIQVNLLRLEQKRQLEALARAEAEARTPARHAA